MFLANNKIVCDARIQDFAPYLGEKARNDDIRELIAADELYCYYPSEMTDKSLWQLPYSNLPPLGSVGITA